MIDIEHIADRVVETVVVPPPKMSWVRKRAQQRQRRRRAALWGTMALPLLVFAGVAWNLADQNPGQQVIIGVDAEQPEGLEIPGFEWFEGDGFRVQLPLGWKLEEFDIVPSLDPEWSAWLPIAIDVPANLPPSSFAPLSAEIWTTIDTWESADSWAQVNFPSTLDAVNFVDFPPITISPRAVSGAVEGVRGEQRYLESYVSSEAEPDTFTDFRFAHGVGVAGLRPDGRVTVFWLTESDLESLDGSRLDTATIDIILDSFTLMPLPEVREVGTGGLNAIDIFSSLPEHAIEDYGDVVFSLVRRSEFIDVYVGYGEDERVCVIASYSIASKAGSCLSQIEFLERGLSLVGRDRPGYPINVVAVVPEDTISAFIGNYQLTIVDSIIAESFFSDSMVFTLETERGSYSTEQGQSPEMEITAAPPLIAEPAPLSDIAPSQSPEDAARDGVIAEIAERSLRERSEPLFTADSIDGTWILGELPMDRDDEGFIDCVGDESGTYPTDFVCTGYFEALLVDEDGSVVRAFPLPDAHPSWIVFTPDDVFIGHIGDGGMPDSVLMRIDRSTYRSQTWIVHHEGIQEIEGAESWWLPAWEIASPSQVAVFESSVSFSFGADGSPVGFNGEVFVGTLVDAGLDNDKVDLVALDAAFPHS